MVIYICFSTHSVFELSLSNLGLSTFVYEKIKSVTVKFPYGIARFPKFTTRARRVRQKAYFAEQIQRCHIILLIPSSSAK